VVEWRFIRARRAFGAQRRIRTRRRRRCDGGPSRPLRAGFLEFGVFYFKNPNSMASIEQSLEDYLARPDTVDRITAMGGITAPGGHPEPLYTQILRQYVYPDRSVESFYGDAFHIVTAPDQIEPVLDRLVEQGAHFVKIYVIHSDEFERRRDDSAFDGNKGLDPALVPLIVRGAHARDLTVAAHIENAADFRVVVAAGVDQAIHMPGYICSEDPLAQYEISEADAAAAARSGLSVVTTATVALRSEERLLRITPIQRTNLLRLKAAGVPIYLGSDGYEHESVIKEARHLVEIGVFDAREALRNLTFHTPRMIFPGRRIGVLAPGYEASFVTLANNPLEDFNGLFSLVDRIKQGGVINVAPTPA
jgi:hypothetical protein